MQRSPLFMSQENKPQLLNPLLYYEMMENKKNGLLMLHHDAVTGTCYPNVMADYKRRGNDLIVKMDEFLKNL